MAKQSPAQKETIERVMHEFKHGELEQRDGELVSNPKQAIAIALHEAGSSNQEDAETNKHSLASTRRKERADQTAQDSAEGKPAASRETRATLYDEAKRKNVPGRSRMTKTELVRAVHS